MSQIITEFKVGNFKCEMTIDRKAMNCRWLPYMPKRMSEQMWAEYRRGRDAAVAELAALIGEKVAVVEV